MPNQFDITPPDPAGAAQDWQQTLARTASIQETVQSQRLANQKTRTSLEQDADFQRALRGIDPSISQIDQLSQIARAAISSGRASDAEKAIQLGVLMQSRDALNDQRRAHAEQMEAAKRSGQIKSVGEFYGNISSPLEKAVADDLYEQAWGEPSPLKKFPFSPELMKSVPGWLARQKEALDDRLKKAQANRADAAAEKDRVLTQVDKDLKTARTKAIDEKRTATVKAGGKTYKPTDLEMRLVRQNIKAQYPEVDTESEDFRNSIAELGDITKADQMKNGGSFTDALERTLASRGNLFKTVPRPGLAGKFLGRTDQRFQSQIPAKGTEALPAGIPQGSKQIGRTPQGQPVFQAPNGKKYVPDNSDDSEE